MHNIVGEPSGCIVLPGKINEMFGGSKSDIIQNNFTQNRFTKYGYTSWL